MTHRCDYCNAPIPPGTRRKYCIDTTCAGDARADRIEADKHERGPDARFAEVMRGRKFEDQQGLKT